ncbi:MAG: nucleoside 2-deoxyribosyltransferase [Candidatus Pacebacteria bacterium]|nr:nucleoside 2-deoxyribosyltransferase [Candidatus Paceibacterota bacterium]
MKIYIAGPLFNEMEQQRNIEISDILKKLKHEVYLPQDDAGIAIKKIITNPKKEEEIRSTIFKKDIEALDWCDTILCLLDGRVPDEGTIFELGYAYAHKKKCLIFKTDSRAMDAYGKDNIMITHSTSKIFKTREDIINYFTK